MITPEESRAIYYIRPLSMLAIVVCHICQSYNNRWAFLFNIGVQVFLVLSGYLYGKKNIVDWKKWCIGRIKRVYLPMFLLLVIAFPIYMFFARDSFNIFGYSINYLNFQGIPFVIGGVDLIPGLRHLWFITAIMFAYLITPILQRLKDYSDVALPFLLLTVAFGYLFIPMRYMFLLSWSFLYAIGYMIANVRLRRIYEIGILVFFIVLAFYVKWDHILNYFSPVGRLFHDVAGVFFVVWGIRLFSTKLFTKIPSFVVFFDKYSFDIFLVHYILFVGPFSMAYLTANMFLNIFLFIIVTAFLTFLFVLMQNRIIAYLNL